MNISILLNKFDTIELITLKQQIDNILKTRSSKKIIAINDLNISVRCVNACKQQGLEYLHEVASLSRSECLENRNMGQKSLAEIEYHMHANGYDWRC